MNKQQLAEMLAMAMNLLNDVRATSSDDYEWSNRQTNDYHKLATMLPESVQDDFWNNATLRGKDLIGRK